MFAMYLVSHVMQQLECEMEQGHVVATFKILRTGCPAGTIVTWRGPDQRRSSFPAPRSCSIMISSPR